MAKKIKNILIVLSIPIFVYLLFFIIRPNNFGTVKALYIMLQQTFIPTILACGLIFMLTLGLYDFSIGAILVLAALIGADLGIHFGYPGLILGCIFIAILLELINGLIYSILKIPSIVVTIGLLMVYETLGNLYKGGGGIVLADRLGAMGRAPYNIILGIFAIFVAFIIFNKTKFGIYIRAVGSSEIIAKNVGINLTKVKILGFIACGFMVGIASIITVSYGGIMMPKTGMSTLMRIFTPLMGCFIGLALSKLINVILGIFIGEFILVMISIGLITIGIDISFQQVITGLFLIILVGITAYNQKTSVVK
jgi:ribose transport system permease protein